MITLIMAAGDSKIVDERFYLPSAKGGGVLRREIWVDRRGNVVRYNFAYINPLIFSGDNGRVVGYDSAHGYHHRHYRGKTTSVKFESLDQIEVRFQDEWMRLAKEFKRAQN